MRKKQLNVADFSIYWDTDCTLLGDLPPAQLQVQEKEPFFSPYLFFQLVFFQYYSHN